MTSEKPSFQNEKADGLISVSTDAYVPRSKVAFWADLVCQHFVPAQCHSVAVADEFHGKMALRSVGNVGVAQIISNGQRVKRTSELISKADSEYFLINVQLSGHGGVHQDGRSAHLMPGDMALFSSTKKFELSFDADFAQSVLTFPADELRKLVPNVDAITATAISKKNPSAQLLAKVAHSYFQTDFSILRDQAIAHASRALLEIAAGTIADIAPSNAASFRSLAKFHLAKIKQFVFDNFCDPNLSVEKILQAVQLSPSHVHRLFASEGQTLSSWIWSLRLTECKRMLENPTSDHLNVMEIGFRCGFSNAAHFSRVFRQKFFVTPSDCRKEAQARLKSNRT